MSRSLNTFEDRLKFLGLSIAGDAENQSKSQRMRDSWARRRREGKPASNKVPYGLQLRGEHDVPVPESAEWVHHAFKWYAQGIGMHVIGKRMDGHAPPHTWLTSRVGEDSERITKTRAATRGSHCESQSCCGSSGTAERSFRLSCSTTFSDDAMKRRKAVWT